MRSRTDQTMPRDELRALQLQRLQAQVAKLYAKVPFYTRSLDAAGVRPDDIKSLNDIATLPFLSKYDLREGFPWGFLATGLDEIVETHMSSGTTGKPVVDAYTRADLDMWGEVMARTLDMGGVGRDDIVQVAYGYGLFTGGFGAHYGAGALGATVLPLSSGNTHRQITTMVDFGTTVLCCTPSYALYIAEYARENGIDPVSLPLRAGFFGAEPWSESMRSQIEADLGIKAYDIYGLSEIIGPGVATECATQNGLHIHEDHFLAEIVDPATGEVMPEGEEGELVLTTLSKEAMPIIRYRTHDITRLIPEPCPCGRTIHRMARVGRRTDDMFIVRGVNVFPAQIEAALLRAERNLPHYQIILSRKGGLDQMEVQVEVTKEMLGDTISELESLQRRFAKAIEDVVGIRAIVTLVEPQSIARSLGKAKRVIDTRKEDQI